MAVPDLRAVPCTATTARWLFVALLVLAGAGLLVVRIGAPAPVRLPVVTALFLGGPGFGAVGALGLAERPGIGLTGLVVLAVGVSLSALVLVATASVYAGVFSGWTVTLGQAALTVVLAGLALRRRSAR
jgi:hypothetical protein